MTDAALKMQTEIKFGNRKNLDKSTRTFLETELDEQTRAYQKILLQKQNHEVKHKQSIVARRKINYSAEKLLTHIQYLESVLGHNHTTERK